MLDLVLPLRMRRLRRALDAMVCRLRAATGRQARRAAPDHPARRSWRARLLARPLRRRATRSHRRASRNTAAPTSSRRSPSPCAPGWTSLLTWGVVATPLTVVPAPTRRSAARRRGGDPVTRMARRGHGAACAVSTSFRRCDCGAFVRDSVGLSGADRQRNIAGHGSRSCRPVAGDVLVVDDIVTTGATACESVRVLQTAGARGRFSRSPTPDALTGDYPEINRREELKTGPRI